MAKRLVYVVTEDWYFCSHRLPMAHAARDAGFEVHVITRVRNRGKDIEREGFHVHPVDWRRRSLSPLAQARSIAQLRGILARLEPAVVHNIALKPAILGSLGAASLGQARIVNSINGLGSAFLARGAKGIVLRAMLRAVVKPLLNRSKVRTIVQNPDDFEALLRLGVRADRITLIPGSGVDTDLLQPLPEPPEPIRIAYVGRMLEDKGLRQLLAAFRVVRAAKPDAELLLAGEPDPENPTSIAEGELLEWASEPGVTWFGHIRDIRDVWAQAHIAVLLSKREGLPKSLLEAAACGRPIVATDVPGCREVVVDGETGILVPLRDAASTAAALLRLIGDARYRARLGAAARTKVTAKFSAAEVARETTRLYDSQA